MDPIALFTTLAALFKENPKAAALVLLWLVLSFLTTLALGKKSQIDAWAEANPRVAGVLKLLRGFGIDPWVILQGLSLIFRGKLPASLQPKRTTMRPPPPGAGAAVGLVAFALLVIACGPPPEAGTNTPRGAAIVLFDYVPDPEDPINVTLGPICGGTAIGDHEFVTAAHCVEANTRLYVDSVTWHTTTDQFFVATLARTAGDLAFFATKEVLPGKVRVAAHADGPAVLVRARGSDIVETPTTLKGFRFDSEVGHGNSGSGVCQGGALVGVIESCDEPDPGNGTVCLPTGGRFTPLVSL